MCYFTILLDTELDIWYNVDMRREICILIGNWQESDKELFFGPLTGNEEWHEFDIDTPWSTIMAELKLFPSKGQARKNGWDKDVEWGFDDFTFGKVKHWKTVLKVID